MGSLQLVAKWNGKEYSFEASVGFTAGALWEWSKDWWTVLSLS